MVDALWFAESARQTFFVRHEEMAEPRALFSNLIGNKPEEVNSRPLMRWHSESGAALDGFLTVTQQPDRAIGTQQIDRIDLVLSDFPNAPLGVEGKNYYRYASLPQALKNFSASLEKSSQLFTSPVRLALAIAAIVEADSQREAIRLLADKLPNIKVNPDKDSDLIFQINRMKVHDSVGIINRFSKWGCLISNIANVLVGGQPMQIVGDFHYAARIYVDISTDAENTEPMPEYVSKLRTLFSVTEDLTLHGDRE